MCLAANALYRSDHRLIMAAYTVLTQSFLWLPSYFFYDTGTLLSVNILTNHSLRIVAHHIIDQCLCVEHVGISSNYVSTHVAHVKNDGILDLHM